MDVSLLLSFILGLPVAILATLKIIDWCKKRQVGNRAIQDGEQGGGERAIQEQPTSSEPVDQAIASIINQAEIAAAVDRQIAEELRSYKEAQRR